MQISETATARGSGFWGYGVYEIELRTRFTTYTDSAQRSDRTVRRYDLRFGSGDSHSDIRTFANDGQRSEFVNKNFTQLKMTEIPLDEQKAASLACPLADLIGEYLSDVTFVMDYLQLRFCGASFSFYNWPVVILPNRRVEIGEANYRNALCGLIGKTVQLVDVYLDTGLTVEFQGGERLTVSLRPPPGSMLPEIAEYSGRNKSGIIWTSGEEPFD